MPEFLSLLPPGQALDQVLQYLPSAKPEAEEVEVSLSLGRVLAQDILSPEALPAFPRSTVDGYALRAADSFGASEGLPAYFSIIGEVPMGSAPAFALDQAQAALIHTGGMLPDGADAVAMLENTQITRPGEMELFRPVGRYENVIRTGEDVQIGQTVLKAGIRLRPAEIGGLMALGITSVKTARPPRVGLLSSGDEVVPPQEQPKPGQVRDVNSYSLAALVQQAGGMPQLYGILPDDAEKLSQALHSALQSCDMVVITAGSSASARDLTARVIHEAGEPGVLVHGVNLRPGKPTILAVCGKKPVIGLPGNPVSALVVARLFVVPLIERLMGIPSGTPQAQVSARLTVNLPSQAGREEWIPAHLVPAAAGNYQAEPIFYKSNLIFSLAHADGLIFIPADATGLSAGEIVQVYLL